MDRERETAEYDGDGDRIARRTRKNDPMQNKGICVTCEPEFKKIYIRSQIIGVIVFLIVLGVFFYVVSVLAS